MLVQAAEQLPPALRLQAALLLQYSSMLLQKAAMT
jgi:hypothetical protein